MNDEAKAVLENDGAQQATPSIYRLFESFIALREKNERQHKLFEQTLARTRDTLQNSFNTFAADTQKAYQNLRQDFQGEKRFSLTLLNELLELSIELTHIVAAKPEIPAGDPFEHLRRWAQAVEIQARKVDEQVRRFGILPYDAEIGAAYNPALHERVGSKFVDGMEGLRIAEQRERGFASQQPEFILVRPKVIITE